MYRGKVTLNRLWKLQKPGRNQDEKTEIRGIRGKVLKTLDFSWKRC